MTGTLSVSQGFEFSDNFDLDSTTTGNTTTSITGLNFGVQSATRTETLQFRIGTQIVGEYGGGANDEFEAENTTAQVDYSRTGSDSALTFSASYSEIDLEDQVITLGPTFGIGFGSGTLVIDDGTAEVTNVRAGFQIGTNSPFGLDLNAGYFEENFTNTTDPSLIDREIVSVDALARFRIDPARTIRALAGYSKETEVGRPIDTENTYIGVGLAGSTGQGLSYSGDLLYDRSEDSGGTTDGIGVAVSVTQTQPAGQVGVDVNSRINDNGRRTEASVNRAITLPTGSLDFSLGVVDQEGDSSLRPRGSVTYQQATPDGQISASLSQDPSIDSGVIYGNTSIALGYTQSINSTSGWSANVSYSASNELNGTLDDERATATLAYQRSLTPEWRMNTGVRHIREVNDSGPTETSNTIFFNIQRDITFGF